MSTYLRLLPRAVSVVLGLVLAGPVFAQAPLPKDSPFVPVAAPVAAAAADEIHEFAAVSTIDRKTSVNIYDKLAKKGRWIAVGETVEGITVKSYDAAREQVVVRIAGVDKLLALRKSTGVGHTAITLPGLPQVMFSAAPVPSSAAPGPATAAVASLPGTAPAAAVPTGTDSVPGVSPAPPGPGATLSLGSAGPPAPPPPVGSVAFQEQEARMLVSDLLEIGIAQRKAYEEAQKKAAGQKGDTTPPAKPPGN